MPLFLCLPEFASLEEKPPHLGKNGARDRVASLHTEPSQHVKGTEFVLANRADQGGLLDDCLQKLHTITIQRDITPQNPLAWPVPITARQPVSCFNGSFTWIKLVLWKAQLLRLLIHVVAFKSQNIYAQNSHWYFKHGPVKCNKNATDCAAGSILLTESLNSLHATPGIHLCLELKPIPFPPRVYHQAPLPLRNICKDA